ncbi:MAG: GNAT family N-acetyltransferase [Acidimicrobiales bacterium]|jgi:CelD/BcsL family acetyltransferase involved in cellulose biosynthesis
MSHRPFVEVVDCLDDVCQAWDDLLDRGRFPSPFLRSWWVNGIGAGPGDTLRIPLVFDGDELIGGIPLAYHRLRRALPWLRSIEMSDYSSVACAPGREPEVLDVLRRWMSSQRTMIDLWCKIPGLAADFLPSQRWILARTVDPYEDLPETFDDYLANRSHKWRSTIRKNQRAAERRGWSVRCVPRDDIDAAIERLLDLHIGQWGTSDFAGQGTRFGRAARAGSARGELVVLELVEGESTLASQVWLEVAGCSYCYQGGRLANVPSAGILLFAAAIERGCRIGQRRLDLLRGDESYKAHWAGQANAVLYLRASTGPLLPRFIGAMAVHHDLEPWRDGEQLAPPRWPPEDGSSAPVADDEALQP